MKADPSDKIFKFIPIDIQQQKQNIEKVIYSSQTLYDFLCESQPFSFQADSPEFNSCFFNGEFKQKNVFEVAYGAPYQKTSFLNYIIINFFTSDDFLNLENTKNKAYPEMIYIDTSNNFNILSLHGLISEHLFLRSVNNPLFKDQNYVEQIINNIFAHLHVYKVYDLKQFMFTLRTLSLLIEKNKQIKMVIIDCLNTFPVYNFNSFMKKGPNSKDKSEASTQYFGATNAKTLRQIMKLVQDARNVRELGFILTRKETFKLNEFVGLNYQEKKLHINSSFLKVFSGQQPLKDSLTPIFLLSFHAFDEPALSFIYNDMEIMQKIDSFLPQNYSVAEILHSGNLSFSIKIQNKAVEMLCYLINKSNFYFLKSYPCILQE